MRIRKFLTDTEVELGMRALLARVERSLRLRIMTGM